MSEMSRMRIYTHVSTLPAKPLFGSVHQQPVVRMLQYVRGEWGEMGLLLPDRRTDAQRFRQRRRKRARPMCAAHPCQTQRQTGKWANGFCQKCALERGLRQPKRIQKEPGAQAAAVVEMSGAQVETRPGAQAGAAGQKSSMEAAQEVTRSSGGVEARLQQGGAAQSHPPARPKWMSQPLSSK